MRVLFAMAADYAAIDQAGKASVVGQFTVLNYRSVPVRVSRFHLLIMFLSDLDDIGKRFTFTVKWVDPDNRKELVLGHGGTSVDRHPTEGPPQYGVAVPVENLAIEAFGPHNFKIEVEGQAEPYLVPIFVRPITTQPQPKS